MCDSEGTSDFNKSAAGIDSTQTLSHQHKRLLPWETGSSKASEQTSSQSTQKRRSRVNKKEIERGNNRHGRGGTPRCLQCRSRKSKCLYTSEWSPCDFCKSRNISEPCYKLRGPKTEHRLSLSRPVPTPSEAEIDAKDALILRYAYSDKMLPDFGCIRTFFRLLTVEYGASIYPASLRHAVLAFATASLPASQFSDQQIDHEQKAIAALRRRLNPQTIREHDVCAAFVLTWMSHTYRRDFAALAHAMGCISISQDLVASTRPQGRSNWISVFMPFMISIVHTIRVLHTLRDTSLQWSMPIRCITFSQRLKFHGELLSGEGLPVEFCRLAAISGLLYGHGFMLSDGILRVLSDSTDELSKRRIVPDILKLVKKELSDPNLISSLQSSGIETDPSDGEVNIPEDTSSQNYIFHELNSNYLLMAILEAPSIQEGLRSQTVTSLAKILVRSFQSVPARGGKRRISFFVDKPRFSYYFWHLLYAGVGLRKEESPEFCSWIIDELVGMELPDKAMVLETFWDNWTDSAFQNVIRACFGHPHRDYIGLNRREDALEMKYGDSE